MKKAIYLILFLTLILLYSPAFAGYKIYLKNGNVINAENIRQVGNELKVYYSAGEIILDAKDIERIVETSGSGRHFSAHEESPGEKGVHTKEGKETKADERTSLIERLGTIDLRRQGLAKQHEQLEKEKQTLDEDIKAEGRLTHRRTIRELTSKQNRLNEKIKEFNNEVESLEKEEKEIHERLNTMK